MASLKISEKLEGNSLILNSDFPLNYNSEKIIAFKEFVLNFEKNNSDIEAHFCQELESMKKFTVTNEEKREEFINLVKFRRDLKKFKEQTIQEGSGFKFL